MTYNSIKPGILAQWKKDKEHWGLHWADDSYVGLKNYRKKLFDTEVYQNFVLETRKITLLRNKEEKELECKNLSKEEYDKELMSIFKKYSSKINELSIERQVYNFQYCFLILEGKNREWKVGNTVLKNQIFWKGMLTRRDNTTNIIWVDETSIEPFKEGSYELQQQLLKKYHERINKKL